MRLLKEIRPLIGNYHVKSGVYHYYRNEFTQAVEYLRKALRDPRSDDTDRRRARHYLTLSLMDSARRLEANGDPDGAIEELRRAAQSSPDFPDIHFRLGRLLEHEGAVDKAIEEYARAIEHAPSYMEAHIALGFCLIRTGRTDRAGEVFARAAELKRERIDAPFREGLQRMREGEPAEAEICFREAFFAVPHLSEECIDRAMAQLRAEEYEGALAELDRALALNPKYPDLHNHRGIALCELNRIDEGIDAFRRSVALSDGFVVPRLNLAFALVRAGEYPEARAELESILERDPSEPAAKAALAELDSERRKDKRRPVTSRGNVR